MLSNPEGSEVNGFAHHKWNGITTLQFAHVCQDIIESDIFDSLIERDHIHHCILNHSVSKYELVTLISKEFQHNITVNEVSDIGDPINRTLSSEYNEWKYSSPKINMNEAISELYSFIKREGFY